MDIVTILLVNGFFLAFLLFVLLLFLASRTSSSPEKKAKIREDLKKIKDQISDEEGEEY